MIYDCLGYIAYNYLYKYYVVSMKPKPQNDGFVNPIIWGAPWAESKNHISQLFTVNYLPRLMFYDNVIPWLTFWL